MYYFRVPINKIKDQIIEKITEVNLSPVFHIDFNGFNQSAFNENVILKEIKDGFGEQYLIKDYGNFLKLMYNTFNEFDPYFITFFDFGGSLQNKNIDKTYKSDRESKIIKMFEEGKINEEEKDRYFELRTSYLDHLHKKFQANGKIVTISLGNYESDLVAHYIISKNLIKDRIHFIFSNDKDLLQTCHYPNVYQITNTYKPSKGQYDTVIWDDKNAIFKLDTGKAIKNFIDKNYNIEDHPFDSRYVTLLLSINGDKVDTIPNLFKRRDSATKKKLGWATSLKFITEQKIPVIYNKDFKLSGKITGYEKELMLNYQLVSFDEQIKRLPDNICQEIEEKVQKLLPTNIQNI